MLYPSRDVSLSQTPSITIPPTLANNLIKYQQQYEASHDTPIAFGLFNNEWGSFYNDSKYGFDSLNIALVTDMGDLYEDYYHMSNSIVLNENYLVLGRSNIAYSDLAKALDLLLDKDTLITFLSQIRLERLIISSRIQLVADLDYVIKEDESILRSQYEKLSMLKAAIKSFRSGFMHNMYEDILSIPEVFDINFRTNRYMDVTIRPIQIPLQDNGASWVELGGYKIKIDFQRLTVDHVKIFNLVNPINGHDHPHVSEQSICWGNLKIEASRYLCMLQITNFIECCIRFLESYNHDDCYITLSHWLDDGARNDSDVDDVTEPEQEIDNLSNPRIIPTHSPGIDMTWRWHFMQREWVAERTVGR